MVSTVLFASRTETFEYCYIDDFILFYFPSSVINMAFYKMVSLIFLNFLKWNLATYLLIDTKL